MEKMMENWVKLTGVILSNYDVIVLIITNVVALFAKQPHKWRRKCINPNEKK